MAYIGNIPAESYASFERQVFTIVNSQTAYTLTHAVTNENDIRLVVNNVVQEPGSGKAYTASGTTLTLSAALVNGTDEMYCVFLGRALQTVNPPNASVGASQLADDAVTTAKILDANVTSAKLASGVLPDNTPAFEAYLSDDVRVNDDALVKVAANTEVFDTDNCYDNSTNYRFTPTTAGKYFVYARATFDEAANNLQMCALRVYKNGSNIATARTNFDNQYGEGATPVITTVVDMNGSSDYLEMYAQADSSNGSQITVQGNATERETNFGAYKLIGV